MAITAIVGRPGHGKSYSATEIAILPALSEGRPIYTNIPLRDEAIAHDYPWAKVTYIDLSPAQRDDPEFWQFEPGALIILDELWKVWPSGLKANNIPVYQLAFIKEHRHRTDEKGRWQDIVLVTQNLSDIAHAVREMVETTVMCSQLQDVGAAGWFVREYFTGPIKGCSGGPASLLVNNERVKYEEKVFRFYVSNTQGTNTSVGPQGAKVVKQTIWGGWKFKLVAGGLGVLILAIILAVWRTSTGLDRHREQARMQTAPAPAPAPAPVAPVAPTPLPPPVAPVRPAPVAEPIPSEHWRLAGVVRTPTGTVAMLTNGRKTRRIDYRQHCQKGAEHHCTVAGELVASWTGPHETHQAGIIQPLQVNQK